MTRTTTAVYRKLAREAEMAADWTHAAYCWGCAVEAYPNARGELAQRDLSAMTTRRDAARRMAAAEATIDVEGFGYVGSPAHY